YRFSSCLEFAPDGHALAISAGDREGVVLIESQAVVSHSEELHEYATGLAFSPDGRCLVVGRFWWGRHNEYALHFLDGRSLIAQPPILIRRDNPDSLAFSPDSRSLAVSCRRRLRVLEMPGVQPVCRLEVDRRHFTAVAFTPDGRFLTATRSDGTVQFYEAGTWRESAAFGWEIGPLTCLDIARDGMRAAVGRKKGKILVWDLDL